MGTSPPTATHPVLKTALRRGWRDLNTVQFGVAPAHAVVLGPVDTATGTFLTLLDGTRGVPLLREEGRRMGLPDGHVDALLHRLTRAGLIDDATGGGPAFDALRKRKGALDRLRPDLAALTVLSPEPAAGAQKLAARRTLRVQVRGTGRVGTVIASVLSAAGIGHVDVRDGGCVEPWDVAPGGLPAESVGERRDTAAHRAVRRAAPYRPPRPDRRAGPPHSQPSSSSQPPPQALSHSEEAPLALAIIAPRDGLSAHTPDPIAAEELVDSGTPHLYAGVIEATGVVGPLVLPGGTACAGCLARDRADRDPTWPRLIAQWRSGHQQHVPACDVALATAVAGLAAAHALAFLDGELPASTGARWEASSPGLDWHARPVWAHPDCPCGADRRSKGEQTSEGEEQHDTMAG
ncbi:ThiF family adenylyltransferase [Streptomyces antnestii]|uniref:ThiF family adenylyltransferase n=1 Tax=Streptomyces antnestii TaxID=2494256 RepID=A0A3S3U7G5_9ACTN|nr:ThiF family adenylyltransferase [Streptomyces sp. San01]RVU17320.1 ThiF family adenylyltransferase [Streptomyces sp. San01]